MKSYYGHWPREWTCGIALNIYLFNKGDCVCVCVLYRWPHCWTYSAQIWHGGPHLPQEVIFHSGIPTPWVGGGKRVVLEVHGVQRVHF